MMMLDYSLHESQISEIFPKRSTVAVIVGNGPSIPRYEEYLRQLTEWGDVAVFGINRVFMCTNVKVDYYLALDRTCWRKYPQQLKDMNCLRYFINERYRTDADLLRVCTYRQNPEAFHFSTDKTAGIGHGCTGVHACMQLAVIMGAIEIHFFGIDCKPDKDGTTHAYGKVTRREQQWKNIKRGTYNGLDHLDRLQISYKIHSDIFEREKVNA